MEKSVLGRLPRLAPFSVSHLESARSCAGALGKGRYGFCRRGGGSLPDPSPGDIPTVRCMGRCRQRTGLGPAPGPAFPRISPALPPPPGRGRSAKRGRGGVHGSSVWVDACGKECFGSPRRPRPSRSLTSKAPAPARGHWGRAGMVFVDGEGVPSPAPPRVISPRSGAWEDAGREQDRGRLPGRPFRGYHLHCPRPTGGGGARSAGGVGVGVHESNVWVDTCGKECFGSPPQACALLGLSPRKRPLRGGSTEGGPVWFSTTGRGFPPRPHPG